MATRLRCAEESFRAAAARGFKVRDTFRGESEEEDGEDEEEEESSDGEDLAADEEAVEPAASSSSLAAQVWGEEQIEHFWGRVLSAAAQPGVPAENEEPSPAQDCIQFKQRTFSAHASSGQATIVVDREGPCSGHASVRVQTLERGFEGYKAKAGKHFEHVEVTLDFAPGERVKSFDVKLHAVEEWSPTLWFAVELVDVLRGNVVFGAPQILAWRNHRLCEGLVARVYIMSEGAFPYNIPKSALGSSFQLMRYYVKERIRVRGSFKFWKTMAALLYDPFHNVIVSTVVQKEMVGWACDWNRYGSGYHWRIVLLASLQLASTAVLAWCDRVQHQNRGRTGATRVYHRWQLLAKMLMLEPGELGRFPGHQWLYTAVMNVESMTMDAYWQSFMLAQSLFALFLSICITFIFFFSSGGGLRTVHPYLFMLSMLLIMPPTFAWIGARRKQTWDILNQRADSEAMWVNTLAWAAQSCHALYFLGPRERAWLEQRFAHESKIFVTRHQIARDMVNDSMWVNRWLASLSYCLVLYVGAIQLVQNRVLSDQGIADVNFVLLLKVSWDFQKYMKKMSDSMTRMQRAGISILRVQELLNYQARPRKALASGASREAAVAENQIELHGVEYILPRDRHSVAPMSNLQMLPGSIAVIPLKRFVRVVGASESARMTFLALAAQVLRPTHGRVLCPSSAWAVLLPSVQYCLPSVSVLDALQVATMPEDLARRWAQVLGLPLLEKLELLGPGQLQELTLVRTLMRDPAVLILDRPLAFIAPEKRARLQCLLRVWQEGGAQQLIQWLTGHRVFAGAGGALSRRRTVVVTGEDMEGDPSMRDDDAHIDLGQLLRKDVALEARWVSADDSEDTGSGSSSADEAHLVMAAPRT